MKNTHLTASTFALFLLLACLLQPLCSCKEQPRPSEYATLQEELTVLKTELAEMQKDLESPWRWLLNPPKYNLNLKKNIQKKKTKIEEIEKTINDKILRQKVYLTKIEIKGLPNDHWVRKVDLRIYYKDKDFVTNDKGELLYRQKGCPSDTSCQIDKKLVKKGATLIFQDCTGLNNDLAAFSLDNFHNHAIYTSGTTGQYTEIVGMTTYTLHYRKEE